jgi:hypothetical protein
MSSRPTGTVGHVDPGDDTAKAQEAHAKGHGRSSCEDAARLRLWDRLSA